MQEEFASKIGTKVAEQLQGFNELMQRVIDNYETWTGVTECFQCKIRLTDGTLSPMDLWQSKTPHWKTQTTPIP